MLLVLGFIFLIFVQDKNTELILDNALGTILTLGVPATLPIYLMVLLFDIVMVAVRLSSSESSNEKLFFKRVIFFEIGFVAIIVYAWLPYFAGVFT